MQIETMNCTFSDLYRPIWTVLCAVFVVNYLTDSSDSDLCSSGSQSPSLLVKIAQIFQ